MRRNSYNDVRNLAKQTLEKYALSAITPDSLKGVLNAEGYTVIRYSALSMSEQTRRLMEALKVTEAAHHVDSFTYADREHRIVFARADISDDEFVKLLALELGRILCVKNRTEVIVRGTPSEEFDAAEFAYQLIDIRRRGIFYNFAKFHAPFVCTTVFLFLFAMCAIVFRFLIIPGFGYVRTDSVTVDTPHTGVENAVTADEKSSGEKTDSNSEILAPSDVSSGEETLSEENQAPTTEKTSASQTDLPKQEPDKSASNPAQNSSGLQGANSSDSDTSAANAGAADNETPRVSDDNFVIPKNERVYYATANGKKYHLSGCSYLKDKDIVEVYQADIDSGKYEPCSRCFKK